MSALRDFVADLMDAEGAAVEPLEPDGLEIIAPRDIQVAFGWPEFARLGFGVELPPGAKRIGIEGEWLDRFAKRLDGRGRRAERMLTNDLPRSVGDPEKVLGHALDLPNGVWRFQRQSATWTRCLLIAFRVTAVSDEKRESILWLGFNANTGAALGEILPRYRALTAADPVWRAPEPDAKASAGPGWDAATLEARARPALEAATRAELAPFLRSMRRRLARDHNRLHGYHDDLRRESLKKLAALDGLVGAKPEADRRRETGRVAAIEREYKAKLGDLEHKYALRVAVDWIQMLELVVPVRRLDVLIKRRKGEREISLDWHPLLRMAEPPLCEWGLGEGVTRLICDERLHLTEAAGQEPCPNCAKAFCRACFPAACPKCGHGVEASRVDV